MIKDATKFKQTEIGPIPEEWKVLPFGKIAKLKKKIYLPTGNDDLKYIGLEHIDQGTLSINGVGNSKDVKSNKFAFENGDILFGKLRPYFRKVYRPKFSGVCSTDIWVVEAQQGIDQGYLFYLVANQDFVDQASAGSGGTRMPRADWGYLEEMEWPVAPIEEQKQIAEILSALDDKIELNCKMNKTLEAIGQAIFKRWFVDFEFPNDQGKPYKSSGGEMVESELGEIPKGWRVGALGEAISNFDSKRIPLSSQQREKLNKIYPYYGATSIMDYVDNYIFDGIYVLLGEDGSVARDDGKPFVQYVNGKIWVNNHAHVLQGKNGFSTEFVKIFLEQINVGSYVTGAVQPKLNQENMNSIPLTIPERRALDNFNDFMAGIYKLILKVESENTLISQIRDLVLPRLMSGKIRT